MAAMPNDSSFDQLLAQLRAGDQDAARRIFEDYGKRLIGLARGRLNAHIRAKVEPEDVVQSAFKSFFLRVGKGQFDLTDWNGLWSLLVVITLRKCGHKIRHFHGQRNDIRRELTSQADADNSDDDWQALAQDPTPSEAAILAETLEELMGSLKERERHMLELHLQGHSIPEISEQVKRSEYTVRDVLKRVRQRLQHLRDRDSGE
jgi:RNA polymerase sigma factor (sigma-70 family)